MRRLLLVLVLANVLMFGWSRGWFDGGTGSSAIGTEENAHRLRPVPLSRLESPKRTPAQTATQGTAPATARSTAVEHAPSPNAAPQVQPQAQSSSQSSQAAAPERAPGPQPAAESSAPAASDDSQPAPGNAPAPFPDTLAPTASEAAGFAVSSVPAVCRAFAPIDEERAQALQAALEQSGARVEARRIEQGASYLVYLPPAASVEEAQQNLLDARRIGREDAFVIQDGPMRMAVSLGLFRFESAARVMVDQLVRAGETRALIAPRPPIQVRIALQARWSESEAGAIATMLGAQFDAPARDCP